VHYVTFPKRSIEVLDRYETLEEAIAAAIAATDPDHIDKYFDIDICECSDEDGEIIQDWFRSHLTSDYRVPQGQEADDIEAKMQQLRKQFIAKLMENMS
jgi:hypothetical protein